MQFLTNYVTIIMSCNSMPAFHYKHVLLITYNLKNISRNIHNMNKTFHITVFAFKANYV